MPAWTCGPVKRFTRLSSPSARADGGRGVDRCAARRAARAGLCAGGVRRVSAAFVRAFCGSAAGSTAGRSAATALDGSLGRGRCGKPAAPPPAWRSASPIRRGTTSGTAARPRARFAGPCSLLRGSLSAASRAAQPVAVTPTSPCWAGAVSERRAWVASHYELSLAPYADTHEAQTLTEGEPNRAPGSAGLEPVARSAHRLDSVLSDLAAQVADIHVHDVGLRVVVVSPYV
jgi:hypothetical protein